MILSFYVYLCKLHILKMGRSFSFVPISLLKARGPPGGRKPGGLLAVILDRLARLATRKEGRKGKQMHFLLVV